MSFVIDCISLFLPHPFTPGPCSVYPLESPSAELLSCSCREKSQGRLAVELGPLWCDDIFDAPFCHAMLQQAKGLSMHHKLVNLLQTICSEAECRSSPQETPAGLNKENALSSTTEEDRLQPEDSDPNSDGGMARKKLKMESSKSSPHTRSPPFYFNLQRYSPKGHDLGKVRDVIAELQRRGHQASRTHFDPEAVRTSASLPQFIEVLKTCPK